MTDWPRLPAVTVERLPPANLGSGDQGLFAHEYRKTFGDTVVRTGTWDAAGDGLLLKPGTPWAEAGWFQAGLPGGAAGWKVRAKGLLAWTRPRRPLEGSGVPLVITDEFSNGYFHWIADALPKLWWLRNRLDQCRLVLPAYAARFPYMAESLAPWPHLRTAVLRADRRTILQAAALVPALAPTGNYRPDLMLGLAETWRDLVRPAAPFRKLYISRAGAPWRKIRNEDEVWAALEPLGFEKVLLENLGFADQVKLLAETALCVSNHGAGLTNILFQVPGTRVVEIRLRGDAANNCYYSLANAVGLEYRYLLADAAEGATDSHTADLRVDVRSLTDLVRTLGEKP